MYIAVLWYIPIVIRKLSMRKTRNTLKKLNVEYIMTYFSFIIDDIYWTQTKINHYIIFLPGRVAVDVD